MSAPDPSRRTDHDRLIADTGAAADLSARLAKAEVLLQTVYSELVELLADTDTAVGVGAAAAAFRTGFGPVSAEAADLLRELTERVGAHREVVTRGVAAVIDADHDAAASLGNVIEPGDPDD
ncbi:hypothetical protein [Gordonia aurantiaca]|uniref:hypothetical protein n=1 Tax=Gordonia sp. B21 TaxID=3151852 RepID=UPI003264AD1B